MTKTTPLLIALVALAGCKGKRQREPTPAPVVEAARDAAAAAEATVDAGVWPRLAHLTQVQPLRVVTLPVKQDVPRFEVGGPVIAGDVAVVASSQFGFAAVDWRRGTLLWTKPAGGHVAPPIVHGGSIVMIGQCLTAPTIPEGEQLLGCMRIATPTGADEAYVAIHGKGLDAFAGAPGTQDMWNEGERSVRWRRGDRAVVIDVVSGVARPASAAPPPVIVSYKDHRWEVAQVEGRVIAREGTREAWSTQHPYTALLGAVYLPEQSPMIRVANLGAFAGEPEVDLLDIDATGSMNGQAAFPVPGIGLFGFATSSIGDVALAVRLDTSLQHDFIAGYAANALLMWVYALPVIPRADPVGVAIASEAVVVFHDGETVTVLPALLAPPTAPGAARAPSQNPTP